MEDDGKSDIGYDAVMRIKIDKDSMANNENTKKLTFPLIKYFYNQGPKVIRVLCEITVSVFEHIGITTWKGIYQGRMFSDQVLKGLVLTKSSNTMLACRDFLRDKT